MQYDAEHRLPTNSYIGHAAEHDQNKTTVGEAVSMGSAQVGNTFEWGGSTDSSILGGLLPDCVGVTSPDCTSLSL